MMELMRCMCRWAVQCTCGVAVGEAGTRTATMAAAVTTDDGGDDG